MFKYTVVSVYSEPAYSGNSLIWTKFTRSVCANSGKLSMNEFYVRNFNS